MFDSYITKDWYRDTYPSNNKFQAGTTPTAAEDTELDNAIFRASRVVDTLTFYRATLFNETDDGGEYVLTDDARTAIMYGTAAQVDYIKGVGDPRNSTSADYSGGFTIGKYSESGKGDRMNDLASLEALDYLRAGGVTKNGFSSNPVSSRW